MIYVGKSLLCALVDGDGGGGIGQLEGMQSVATGAPVFPRLRIRSASTIHSRGVCLNAFTTLSSSFPSLTCLVSLSRHSSPSLVCLLWFRLIKPWIVLDTRDTTLHHTIALLGPVVFP